MIVLKILAAPFVVVLTVLAAVVSFLFCMATAVFVVACVVLTLLAVRYVQPVLADFAAQLSEEAALPAVFFTMFDGILSARVLLLTHDIDALTPRALVTISRRTA